MSQASKLLVITDDPTRRHELSVMLNFVGEASLICSAKNWQAEVELAGPEGTEEFLALLLDISGEQQNALLQAIIAWNPALPVILFKQSVVNELSDDAKHRVIATLSWPINYNQLLDILHRAQMFREQVQLAGGQGLRREANLFRSLVGSSRGVQQIRELMSQVADKEVTVLIQGESGTGKEVVARNLHYHSKRRDKPFVPVNCGAIPHELIESELFGHEKGAFTGAITARAGRFEMAEGGTLFLDEIGDLPLAMQVKLLRVLQERTFERVGGNKTLTCDIRVVAATHRNLEQMISEGSFREDLYYRLNVFPIDMPALRERTEDIPLLLHELVVRLEKEQRGSIRFNSAAIMSLIKHLWPGNVREMANLVERLAIMHPYGVIGLSQLPIKYRHIEEDALEYHPAITLGQGLGQSAPALLPVNGLDLKEHLAELEKNLIEQALDDAEGVVARAAEKLHIRRTTLVEKMRKYHIQKRENIVKGDDDS